MKKINILINPKDRLGYIHPEVYGHFSEHLGRCIYEGIFVGESSEIPNEKGIRKDIAEAFRQIKVPVIRWPGGCFAEEYHWMEGIGPKESRKKLVNTNWGGVVEDNSFGTHEFMELCRQVGCKPYINGNVGSGTIREMAEWVEYMTSDAASPMADLRRQNGQDEPWKLEYLGVGNENWGCGGNMRPERYADKYREFQSFCKNYGENRLKKIACGPSSADYNWMEVMMKNLDPDMVSGIDLHYYTMPIWPKTDSATDFTDELFYKTMDSAFFADELLTRHSQIMDRYDPENRIGIVIGEWGCWHSVEPGTNGAFLYQQNAMRDALVAAIELNIFNSHAKRVMMANLAQTVNVLQSVILTEGKKLVKTPTYHVFDMYKEHQGGEALYAHVDCGKADDAYKAPMVSCSASIKEGKLTVTLANCSLTEDADVECLLPYLDCSSVKAVLLSAEPHAYNDFEHTDRVCPKEYTADISGKKLLVKLPACSVVSLNAV